MKNAHDIKNIHRTIYLEDLSYEIDDDLVLDEEPSVATICLRSSNSTFNKIEFSYRENDDAGTDVRTITLEAAKNLRYALDQIITTLEEFRNEMDTQ